MFGKLKKKAPKINLAPPKEPRQLAEIEQEYAKLAQEAGAVQYQVFVLGEQLKQINARMLEVNKEANERNKLTEAAKAEEKAEGSENV